MMRVDEPAGSQPQRAGFGRDDARAVRIFFGGVLLLAVFFGAGVFVARLGRGTSAPAAAPQDAPRRADSERYLVEIAVLDTQEKAGDLVQRLRRQYASAWAAQDAADRLYHVYAGPYPLEQAQTVADDLRQQGVQSVAIKPYQPRSSSGM